MIKTIKSYSWIIFLSFLCIFLGILTFFSFINKEFLSFSDKHLQSLLIADIFLLVVFFYFISKRTIKLFNSNKKNTGGSATSLKYISLFSLFTFIPSFLIAIFSLLLFSYGLENFFNKKITDAVNNSYDVAKNYLAENKRTVESDVFLMSVGLNRASSLFYSNKNRFVNIVRSEKLLRRIDDVFLIDSTGNILLTETQNTDSFVKPTDENFNKALEGLPVIISNNLENKTSVIIKLNSLIDTYLYISRNVDPLIINYLKETQEAVNFYYTVENNQLGIKITFAIIYIIIVTLLLFLSTVISMSFANRLTKPIINLINASVKISKGIFDSKVPNTETDQEFKLLNNNFNSMIDKLKKQQDRLLITERYSAWETVARKLAHEIKNPLTPIQLSIDRIREKYQEKITDDKDEFKNYLETINRQIKDIENLVNEFSNFARMPLPVLKKLDIYAVINRAINFYKMSSKNLIIINKSNKLLFIKGDEEQLYRAFINLIKNSEDSILEKKQENDQFAGKIEVAIKEDSDYIEIKLLDNGVGLHDAKQIMKPYFTTKKNGTGLGLPIVSKIINEHSGDFSISNCKDGVEVLISIPKFI